MAKKLSRHRGAKSKPIKDDGGMGKKGILATYSPFSRKNVATATMATAQPTEDHGPDVLTKELEIRAEKLEIEMSFPIATAQPTEDHSADVLIKESEVGTEDSEIEMPSPESVVYCSPCKQIFSIDTMSSLPNPMDGVCSLVRSAGCNEEKFNNDDSNTLKPDDSNTLTSVQRQKPYEVSFINQLMKHDACSPWKQIVSIDTTKPDTHSVLAAARDKQAAELLRATAELATELIMMEDKVTDQNQHISTLTLQGEKQAAELSNAEAELATQADELVLMKAKVTHQDQHISTLTLQGEKQAAELSKAEEELATQLVLMEAKVTHRDQQISTLTLQGEKQAAEFSKAKAELIAQLKSMEANVTHQNQHISTLTLQITNLKVDVADSKAKVIELEQLNAQTADEAVWTKEKLEAQCIALLAEIVQLKKQLPSDVPNKDKKKSVATDNSSFALMHHHNKVATVKREMAWLKNWKWPRQMHRQKVERLRKEKSLRPEEIDDDGASANSPRFQDYESDNNTDDSITCTDADLRYTSAITCTKEKSLRPEEIDDDGASANSPRFQDDECDNNTDDSITCTDADSRYTSAITCTDADSRYTSDEPSESAKYSSSEASQELSLGDLGVGSYVYTERCWNYNLCLVVDR